MIQHTDEYKNMMQIENIMDGNDEKHSIEQVTLNEFPGNTVG